MEALRKLRTSFQQEAAKHGPLAFYDAVVTAVDAAEYTCDMILDEGEHFEVRLRAIISDNHSIDVLPKVGTNIVVGKLGDDDYILIAADEITEYRVTIGTTVIKLDETGTLISKGDETLNKILNDLVQLIIGIGAFKDVPGLTLIKTRINNLLK